MIEKLNVFLNHFGNEVLCGQLVQQSDKVYFKYANAYLQEGFNISPLKMQFTEEIQASSLHYMENLFGVFHDSLPDGWGHLLLLKFLHRQGIPTHQQTTLLKLSCLSSTAKGGLIYRPAYDRSSKDIQKTIEELYHEVMNIYHQRSTSQEIDEIFALGGSLGGARPKIDAWIHTEREEIVFSDPKDKNYELYIIKFKSDSDYEDIAKIEYTYLQMAKLAGLEVPLCRLIEGNNDRVYFATKRFDREGTHRIHTISVAGLLHDNYRQSNIDYGHIMDAAFHLKPHFSSYEQVLRLAIFNILAHNKDDHSKNISFLADKEGVYHLSPCYDLTFSYGINTYRSTAVGGEQRLPSRKHIRELANHFGVKTVEGIIEQVYEAIKNWPQLSTQNRVSEDTIQEINQALSITAKSFFTV